MYSGKRVLVTGGAGAIGGNLCMALAAAGAVVTILDDLSSAEKWNLPKHARIEFLQGDILAAAALDHVFARRPQIIFHLAALFANQNSVENPERDLMVNGLGTLRVLTRAQECGAERAVYVSSGCSIYGDTPLPVREDAVSLHLRTPYQITKMLGELYSNFFAHHAGLAVVKARLFNSFGPGEIPGRYRNVIPNFIYRALKQQPLPLTGPSEATRDFTFVSDIVEGLMRAGAVAGIAGQEFNIASGRETKIGDVATIINRLTGNRGGVVAAPRRAWDDKDRMRADISRARATLGYEPNVTLEEGLKRTVAWFRAQWPAIDAVDRLPQSG